MESSVKVNWRSGVGGNLIWKNEVFWENGVVGFGLNKEYYCMQL